MQSMHMTNYTNSETYSKNDKNDALRRSTITISELAALAREYMQLKTRKNLS